MCREMMDQKCSYQLHTTLTGVVQCTQAAFLSKQDRPLMVKVLCTLHLWGAPQPQYCMQLKRRPPCMASGFLERHFHYNNGSNPVEEIRLLEFFVSLIQQKPDLIFYRIMTVLTGNITHLYGSVGKPCSYVEFIESHIFHCKSRENSCQYLCSAKVCFNSLYDK